MSEIDFKNLYKFLVEYSEMPEDLAELVFLRIIKDKGDGDDEDAPDE